MKKTTSLSAFSLPLSGHLHSTLSFALPTRFGRIQATQSVPEIPAASCWICDKTAELPVKPSKVTFILWFHETCTMRTYIGWDTSMIWQTSRKRGVLTAQAKNFHICADYACDICAGQWSSANFVPAQTKKKHNIFFCIDDSVRG